MAADFVVVVGSTFCGGHRQWSAKVGRFCSCRFCRLLVVSM